MFRKLGKQDESTPLMSLRLGMRRATAQEDQQEEESVHVFYVLIHVLIKLNPNPSTPITLSFFEDTNVSVVISKK